MVLWFLNGLDKERELPMADANDRVVELLLAQGTAIGEIKQMATDMHDRLFVSDGPGSLKALTKKDDELTQNHDALKLVVAGIKADSRVEKAYVVGYSSAVATGLGFVAKYVAHKFGWHF